MGAINLFKITKLALLVYAYSSSFHTIRTAVNEKLFTNRYRKGFRLTTEDVEYNITSTELIMCASTCCTTGDCHTASWNSVSKECLLSSKDVTNDAQAHESLYEEDNWNTYSWKEFTVFVAKYRSINTHTYNQSYELCLEHGTAMAGSADLLYSFSLGFEYNRCFWMSDGYPGYIPRGWITIKRCYPSWYPWALCILN